MRSGILYRFGMAAVVAASLIGLVTLFFPDSVDSARTAISDVANQESDSGEVASGTAAGSIESSIDSSADTAASRSTDTAIDSSAVVSDEVDLRIETKQAVADLQVRWAITVANDGQADEPGPVTLRATLPPSADFISFSGRNWRCAESDDEALVCSLTSGVAAGQRSDLIILVDAKIGGVQPFTAAVTGVQPDANLTNNVIGGSWVLAEPPSQPADDDKTEQESLPRTGTGTTIVFAIVGLGMCFAGFRLIRMVPSLLQEFREGPLWPGTQMRNHFGGGQRP